ncbi:MAG TPA: TetR/AcrR family transcriptional regulator [Candidatus Binataceae bacterium]|nr:TetR/AcrR family transcriptional regulator [Candidatus Binataceae bacterium]
MRRPFQRPRRLHVQASCQQNRIDDDGQGCHISDVRNQKQHAGCGGAGVRMRVSKQTAARNREQILIAAARLFRERGIEGTGVDSITAAAGLTHGGLYSHFGSKRAILIEAIRFALAQSRRRWESGIDRAPARAVRRIVEGYLSRAHRDRPGSGCLVAALGCDMARQSAAVRRAFTAEVEGIFDLLAALMPGRTRARRRAAAAAAFACMLGALIIARAVDKPRLSGEIMRDAASHIAADAGRAHGIAHARRTRTRRVYRGAEKRNGRRDRSRRLHRRSDRQEVRG